MEVLFSRHAKRQMKWRGISREEILQVIDNPECEEKTHKEKINLFRTIEGRHLKVTIQRGEGRIVVITAILRRKGRS